MRALNTTVWLMHACQGMCCVLITTCWRPACICTVAGLAGQTCARSVLLCVCAWTRAFVSVRMFRRMYRARSASLLASTG